MEKITLNHLRLLAHECGLIHSSLTKPNLINYIERSCLPKSIIRTKPSVMTSKSLVYSGKTKKIENKESSQLQLGDDGRFRIFSIDMGIRNLAICQMTVSRSDPFGEIPIIEKWTKLNMEDYLNMPDLSSSAGEKVEDELDRLDSPIGMTKIAYKFALSHIFDNHQFSLGVKEEGLKLKYSDKALPIRIPDIVLIERQRDRSMPNTATPGWTAKVNRLEGMIYSTIYTISQQHNLDIMLEPILPGKVAKYWIREMATNDEEAKLLQQPLSQENTNRRAKAKLAKTTKNQRTILVADLFDQCLNGDPRAKFQLSNRADDRDRLVQVFFNANKAKRADKKKTALNTKLNNKDPKEDDLADSMLQALTWIKWQQAREIYGGIIHNQPSEESGLRDRILEANANLKDDHASFFR